jgi:hypothetical protein
MEKKEIACDEFLEKIKSLLGQEQEKKLLTV